MIKSSEISRLLAVGAHNIDSVARAATRHRVASAAALPEAGVFMSAQLRVYVQPDEV